MFYIKKITYSGTTVEPACIEFEKGLNIIYGPSDTGKSYIAETVSFMTGGSECRIDPATKYTHIRMDVETDSGSVQMDRDIAGGDITVVSTVPDIESDTYKPDARAAKSISDVWLSLIGIKHREKIIKSPEYVGQTLSIRSMAHLYNLDEEGIDNKASVLFPRHDFTQLSSQSAILYLLTEKTYWDGVNHETKKEKDTKKSAQVEYLEKYVQDMREQREKIEIAGYGEDKDTLNARMQELMSEIDSAESDISVAVIESRNLAKQISVIDKSISSGIIMLERYRTLQKQYESDIRRLTFIVEGEVNRADLPVNTRCPFCDGELPKRAEESCAMAAKAEVERLIPQINDLEVAIADLQAEIDEYKVQREELESARREQEAIINAELQPRVQELRNTLRVYTERLERYQEYKTFSYVIEDMGMRLRDLEDVRNVKEHYDVQANYTEENFINDFSELIKSILLECQFDGLETALFSFKQFDAIVNGKEKKRFGQGYRAYINTVVLLALHEYLHLKGKHQLGMLVVDSPTLTLKEHPIEDDTSLGMKKGLFTYMASHQRENEQIIIIENDIPEIDYKKYDVNLIQFTGKKGEGRYGLLNGEY